MRLLDAGATVDVDLFDNQVFWVAVDNLMTVSSVNLPGKICQYTNQGCFFIGSDIINLQLGIKMGSNQQKLIIIWDI